MSLRASLMILLSKKVFFLLTAIIDNHFKAPIGFETFIFFLWQGKPSDSHISGDISIPFFRLTEVKLKPDQPHY